MRGGSECPRAKAKERQREKERETERACREIARGGDTIIREGVAAWYIYWNLTKFHEDRREDLQVSMLASLWGRYAGVHPFAAASLVALRIPFASKRLGSRSRTCCLAEFQHAAKHSQASPSPCQTGQPGNGHALIAPCPSSSIWKETSSMDNTFWRTGAEALRPPSREPMATRQINEPKLKRAEELCSRAPTSRLP